MWWPATDTAIVVKAEEMQEKDTHSVEWLPLGKEKMGLERNTHWASKIMVMLFLKLCEGYVLIRCIIILYLLHIFPILFCI